MELFEELCNRNEVSPLPGPLQKDSVVLEILLGEIVLLFSSQNYSTSQN